jgi:hypothetical protein
MIRPATTRIPEPHRPPMRQNSSHIFFRERDRASHGAPRSRPQSQQAPQTSCLDQRPSHPHASVLVSRKSRPQMHDAFHQLDARQHFLASSVQRPPALPRLIRSTLPALPCLTRFTAPALPCRTRLTATALPCRTRLTPTNNSLPHPSDATSTSLPQPFNGTSAPLPYSVSYCAPISPRLNFSNFLRVPAPTCGPSSQPPITACNTRAPSTSRLRSQFGLGDQDLAGGVVEEAQQGEFWAAIFQLAVNAGVEQKHLALASAGQTALTMSGSAAFAGRADSGAAEKTTESFAAERKTFDLSELFAEMVIVEARVARAGEIEDAGASGFGKAARGLGRPWLACARAAARAARRGKPDVAIRCRGATEPQEVPGGVPLEFASGGQCARHQPGSSSALAQRSYSGFAQRTIVAADFASRA